MDGGAWQAAVHGVVKSQKWLKRQQQQQQQHSQPTGGWKLAMLRVFTPQKLANGEWIIKHLPVYWAFLIKEGNSIKEAELAKIAYIGILTQVL